MADHDPMTDVACGEPALSTELRDALTLLRDRSDDEQFRAVVDDVLAGRCGLLDAAGTAAFGQAVFAPVAQELGEQFGQLMQDDCRTFAGGTESTQAPCSPCGGCSGGCAGICAALGASPPG